MKGRNHKLCNICTHKSYLPRGKVVKGSQTFTILDISSSDLKLGLDKGQIEITNG